MGIGFDWEQEDEERRQRQASDEHFLELQALKKRRARMAVLGFAGLLALAGLIIFIRQKVAEQEVQRDFERTIEGEIRAIRVGDKSAFLGFQENVKPWFGNQWDAFDEYQREKKRIVAGSQILDSQADGEHGKVTVQEMVDGRPYRVTWFYEYGKDGWKHSPPLVAYWGDSERLSGEHVRVDAYQLDHEQAAAIQAQVEEWWATACRLTACRDGGPRHVTIRLEFNIALQPRWSPDDESVLEIPSPHLGRVPEDGALDPGFRQALARLFAAYWASWSVPARADSTAEVAWLHAEIEMWLAHEMGVEASAPLLGPLAERGGTAAVMELAGRIQSGETPIQALRTVSGGDPLEQPFGWGEYLAARLRAEAALIAGGKREAAARLYGDPERPRQADDMAGIAPGSIQVTGVEESGDITWAEMTYTRQDGGEDAPVMAVSAPFRAAGDEWLHTAALPADFGPAKDARSGRVTLHVADLDAPAVDLSRLDADFEQAAADLGISPQEIDRLEVTVSPSAAGDDPWGSETPLDFGGGLPGAIQMTVPSPRLAERLASQSIQEAARGRIARDMVIRLIRYRAYTVNPRSPLIAAFARWELGRLGLDEDAFLPVTARFANADTRSLSQMWTRCQAGPFVREDAFGARVLIDLLVKQHGPEAVSALLANLSASEDVDSWLKSSLKVSAEDIEAQWASATRTAINAAR